MLTQLSRLLELNRRIQSTRLCPRIPAAGVDSPYRDQHTIRWIRVNDSWTLDLNDTATRAELLRRLPGAKIAQSGLRYFGSWGAFETQLHPEWEVVITLLYEAFDLGFTTA